MEETIATIEGWVEDFESEMDDADTISFGKLEAKVDVLNEVLYLLRQEN